MNVLKKAPETAWLQTLVIALFWVLRTGLTLKVILSQPANKFLSKWIISISKPTKFPRWCPPCRSVIHLPDFNTTQQSQICQAADYIPPLKILSPLLSSFAFAVLSLDGPWLFLGEGMREFWRPLWIYELTWQVSGKSTLLLTELEFTITTGYLKTFLFFSIKKRAKHFRLS